MPTQRKRTRAWAAVLLACAILFGAVSGIALDRLVLLPRAGYAGEPAAIDTATAADSSRAAARRTDGVRGGQGPGGVRPSGERYLRHLETELGLSPEQRGQVAEILQNQQARVMEITRETRPQIRAVAEDTRNAIREVLTPEQWERFQELRRRRDRHRDHGERERDTARRAGGSGL